MHHSLDRKGRVDLEQLDLAAFPELAKLKARGLEAELLPGDLLFLPMSRLFLESLNRLLIRASARKTQILIQYIYTYHRYIDIIYMHL